jgi:uncharacterized membrane protein
MAVMMKDLFKFGKEDTYMWAGIGAFSVIMILAMSVLSSTGVVIKDLFGLVVVMVLPGYAIVKLFLDNVEVSENLTQNPTINKAIDKFIMSMGCSIICVVPLNFLWNYFLDLGISDSKGDLKGVVEDEMMYSGSASWRSLFTVVLVIGIAFAVKFYQMKKAGGTQG